MKRIHWRQCSWRKMVIFRRIPNCISHLLLRITSSQRSQFLCSFILGALFPVSVRLYQVGLSQVVTSSQTWPKTKYIPFLRNARITNTEYIRFLKMNEYWIVLCYFSNSTIWSPPFEYLNSLYNLWQHCIRPPQTSLVTQTQWPSMTGLTRSGFTGDI